jgi:RimJ/RimL family protein N-acetyltransferase
MFHLERRNGHLRGRRCGKREAAMSAVLKSFGDLVSPTLLKRGSVGIGPVLPQDVSLIFTWMNDVEANGLDLPHRPTDGRNFATWLSAVAADTSRIFFTIRIAGNANAVGFVILQNLHLANRSADLGIRIGDEHNRGQGIGKAATKLALDYAWDHLNLVRVQLRVMADNERAVRTYTACGFQLEGRHTKAVFTGGRWHDMLTMAALNPAA